MITAAIITKETDMGAAQHRELVIPDITIVISPILPVEWQGANWGALSTADKDASKDNRSRLARYDAHLDALGWPWHKPDLVAYRDELSKTLAASTVSAHLATIRARYKALLRDPCIRSELYQNVGEQLSDLGHDDNPANRGALFSELEAQIVNAIDPKSAPVKVICVQDAEQGEQIRLTRGQASKLIAAPGLASTKAIRDTAIIALALCTGLREFELCALDVDDLRAKTEDGQLACRVRLGKGRKKRLVLYGDLDTCLAYVDTWLAHTGITDGAVFRGLYKSGRLRPSRLVTRSVRNIMASYQVVIDGELKAVAPHDLRRTYARRLYDAGVDLVAIQQNLGHADLKTTLKYIGLLDSTARKPPAVYDFDLTGLDAIAHQEIMGL